MLASWATAPFRGVGTPDGCCTAPSTLALRLTAVNGGLQRVVAGLPGLVLLPDCGLAARLQPGSARPPRAFHTSTHHIQSPVRPVAPAAPPPRRGGASCTCRARAGRLKAARRAPRKRRVSGLEPGGPAWPRCVSRRRGGARGRPPSQTRWHTALFRGHYLSCDLLIWCVHKIGAGSLLLPTATWSMRLRARSETRNNSETSPPRSCRAPAARHRPTQNMHVGTGTKQQRAVEGRIVGAVRGAIRALSAITS